MSLKTKLLLAQAPLGISLLLIVWIAISTVSRLGEHSRGILKDNFQSVLAAQRMMESIERLDRVPLFLITGRRAEGLAMASEHHPRFEAQLRIEEGNLTEPGEAEAAQELRRCWTEYEEVFTRSLSSPKGLPEEVYRKLEPRFRAVKGAARKILEINQDAMVHRDRVAQLSARRLNTALGGVALLALSLGVIGAVWLTRRLLVPLSSLVTAVRRIGERDLMMRTAVLSDDEIGELAREFNQMADRLAEYERSATGKLLQAQRATQAAIDSIPYPVLVLGVDRTVISVNESGRSLLKINDVKSDENPLTRLEPELRDVIEKARDHVASGKGPYIPPGFEVAVRVAAPREDRYLLARGTPLYAQNGSITGVTVVLQDVTRLRRFHELKDDLVATVAHEFRTPLTSLHMAIHLCVEEKVGPLTEKQLDLLHAARQDCERLQGIVDDLLELARLHSGKAPFDREPHDPRSLVDGVLEAHRNVAADKGIVLEQDVAEPLPRVLVVRDSILRVFSNLVTNGLRHTRPGGTVRILAREEGVMVRFEVTDTGEGIAPEYQKRIFERFFRVPGQTTEGAGLGLAIAREIVTRHGGTIGVESEVGQGSCFFFTIPSVASDVEAGSEAG